MSGGGDIIDKLNFELTQSVTSSDTFIKGDTVEVSFLAKGSTANGAFTEQYGISFYKRRKCIRYRKDNG